MHLLDEFLLVGCSKKENNKLSFTKLPKEKKNTRNVNYGG